MTSRRSALALVVLLVCPACGEMQDAEPLTKTVPAAAAVFGTALLASLLLIRCAVGRWRGSRMGSAPPLTYPRATMTLMLAPAAVVTWVVAGGMSSAVAFGYRDPHIDSFTWEETLVYTVVLTGFALLALAASAAIGAGLVSDHRRERLVGRTLLVLAIVSVSLMIPGAGVVWLPAAIACSRTNSGPGLPSPDRSGEDHGPPSVPRETAGRGRVH